MQKWDVLWHREKILPRWKPAIYFTVLSLRADSDLDQRLIEKSIISNNLYKNSTLKDLQKVMTACDFLNKT